MLILIEVHISLIRQPTDFPIGCKIPSNVRFMVKKCHFLCFNNSLRTFNKKYGISIGSVSSHEKIHTFSAGTFFFFD
jgi:hypothetical protein